eukprot:CAMPEP_0174273762 /NCGR_PEP_ID=MMETSP0439-20130205/55685_1 /TAXON_ID=0 /ORGANISM="Stereomyxa ramosa, Strain Chinc5" /LENGTH=849 /DNA_ID=CAMNT_0015365135 /DNA_START=78 /DNA_END=2624 /DNA_ORIENTATION=-
MMKNVAYRGSGSFHFGRRLYSSLPSSAQVVVIGGGISGSSTAYHLTTNHNITDVVVLEQNRITSGTTWHAAGLVTAFKGDEIGEEMVNYSIKLYSSLKDDLGQSSVGWHNTGSLLIARTPQRFQQLKRGMVGLRMTEAREVSGDEAATIHPFIDPSVVHGAVYLPNDGIVNPADVCSYLMNSARKNGVSLYENCRVTGFTKDENNRIKSVITTLGEIKCEDVLITCGMWTPQIAALAGAHVPMSVAPHQYVLTEKVKGMSNKYPVVRDFDSGVYIKPEVGGFLVGEFDQYQDYVWHRVDPITGHVPHDVQFEVLAEVEEKSENGLSGAMELMPVLEETGIKSSLHGPDAHSMDHHPILGQVPHFDNLFVAAGFNSTGIALGGGTGKAMAEWISTHQQPTSFTYDFWEMDIRRYYPEFSTNYEWLKARAAEGYRKNYKIHWPHEEFETARNQKLSALHSVLYHQGAVFGQAFCWERPNWFAKEGEKRTYEYSFNHLENSWFKSKEREYYGCRENVAIFDMSSFGKLRISGKDAKDALSWLCSNNVDRKIGSTIYTQMLNPFGGIESDITFSRIGEEEYYAVTGAGTVVRDHHYISKHVPSNLHRLVVEDVSHQFSVLAVMGPKSREVLEEVTTTDLRNEWFPFGTTQLMKIDKCDVRAIRVSYVGELGWELHVPVAHAEKVYHAIKDAGKKHHIIDAGYKAINAMRIEKRFVHWGHDVTPKDTPLDCGLPFNSKVDFCGKQELLRLKTLPRFKKFLSFSTKDVLPSLWGREKIYRNGEPVGWLTSGDFSHHLQRPLGLGYVHTKENQPIDADWLKSGEYQLEIMGEKYPANIHLKPVYDPKGTKMKQDKG